MKKESMQISFDGQSHQVDANTLINMLVHYSSVIQQTNTELSGGSRNVRVNINAFKEGSFVIDICLSEGVKSLFSSDTIQYLAGLVTVVGGAFSLYKHFKGKPIDKEQECDALLHIKGNNNVIIQNTIRVYNDRVVRSAISKSIQTASEDTSVEGITISGKEIEDVTFERDDFPQLIYDDFDMEDDRPDEMDEYVDTMLVITGLKFNKGGRWDFVYNGFNIHMIVKDDALMTEIDNGARFGKGDSIKVRMKINKKLNQELNVYENKRYKIVEFYEHIVYGRPNQGKLF